MHSQIQNYVYGGWYIYGARCVNGQEKLVVR